jgi:hypothetical protein
MWMQGSFTGVGHPYWVSPSGYGSARSRLQFAQLANGLLPPMQGTPYEEQLETLEIVAGTPDQVIAGLRVILERVRPSILMMWGSDGKVSHADAMRCIELLGKEVVPAVREIGDELGLRDPFELDTPISLQYS